MPGFFGEIARRLPAKPAVCLGFRDKFAVFFVHRAERAERRINAAAAAHDCLRAGKRRVAYRLIRLLGHDHARERRGHGEVHVALVQHACGEGDGLPLKGAVERDAASAAADNERLRLAAHGFQLQTAKALIIASGGQTVQLANAARGKDLLGGADAGDFAVFDADHAVGDFLREVKLVQRTTATLCSRTSFFRMVSSSSL